MPTPGLRCQLPTYRTADESKREINVAAVETTMAYNPVRRSPGRKSKTTPESEKESQTGTMKKNGIFCGYDCATLR